jgi:hypothetical protein
MSVQRRCVRSQSQTFFLLIVHAFSDIVSMLQQLFVRSAVLRPVPTGSVLRFRSILCCSADHFAFR